MIDFSIDVAYTRAGKEGVVREKFSRLFFLVLIGLLAVLLLLSAPAAHNAPVELPANLENQVQGSNWAQDDGHRPGP